jgi:hypothetical protein
MNIPIQFGWPQVILFIIAFVGLVLFISMITGIIIGEEIERDEDDREDAHARGSRKYIRRRRLRAGRGLTGILLLLLAASLLWVTFLVQTYLGVTGEIKVAHVRASTITNAPHMVIVELTLYDKDGHQTSDSTYLMQGDEWMLQGDIVKFPTWLNIVGLHSGYKLTRLEGRFDDPNLERNSKHTVIELNGGDDNFFKTAYTQRWLSPFVDAAYGNAVFQASGSFDVFATQDALIARPTG